jgi:hypothetical protein
MVQYPMPSGVGSYGDILGVGYRGREGAGCLGGGREGRGCAKDLQTHYIGLTYGGLYMSGFGNQGGFGVRVGVGVGVMTL